MSTDFMNYNLLVEDALRGVVRAALERISDQGLPGSHHFYVSFRTNAPGVEVPSYLKERYPEEMTIVLQHQFWGLQAGPTSFAVTLSFNKVQERLVVPYDALTSFADPSVQFGLQFRNRGAAAAADDDKDDLPAADDGRKSGEVVTLDKFRKK